MISSSFGTIWSAWSTRRFSDRELEPGMLAHFSPPLIIHYLVEHDDIAAEDGAHDHGAFNNPIDLIRLFSQPQTKLDTSPTSQTPHFRYLTQFDRYVLYLIGFPSSSTTTLGRS